MSLLFFYLGLLLTALYQLLSSTALPITVFRGVAKDMSSWYTINNDVVWWGLSSATTTMHVLQSEQFLGMHGDRTFFHVTTRRAVDIHRYSAIPSENEMLLFPGTQFVVRSVLNAGAGLHIIQLQENAGEQSLLTGFS
jgi:hypothetical protein